MTPHFDNTTDPIRKILSTVKTRKRISLYGRNVRDSSMRMCAEKTTFLDKDD